jgi:outer membrane protein
MNRAYLCRILLLAEIGVLAAAAQNTAPQDTAEVRRLTLTDAVHLALTHNRELKIARLKVAESEQNRAQAKASYFPELKNESTFLHTTALENIGVPAGAFGVFPTVGPVPGRDILIAQGRGTFETSGTMLAQPLTQLIRIHQADRTALSQISVSRDDLKKAETEVALKVHELYYSILVAHLQKRAAEQETAFAQTSLSESEQDVRNGNALKIAVIEGNAGLLQSKQDTLTIDLQLSDLNTQLNDLLGLPLDTTLELSEVQPAILDERPRVEYERIAWAENPQIQAAAAAVEQARAGVTSAKSAYIPDITAIARQSYQNGVPFVVHNFGTFGLTLTYDVFDFGKRRAAVREREEQLAEAQENLVRLKEAVSVQVERSYNKVEQTKQMLQVAKEVVRLRAEGERLAQNQLAQGVELVSYVRKASAASYKAQADLLQAQLGYLLANAELEQTIGRTPGL